MTGLKHRLLRGDSLVGSWISIGHPAVAEINAMIGFDFLLIDMEHTSITIDAVQNMVYAIEAADGDTRPVVRAPDNDPVWIKRLLDTGVENIMIPRVNTVREARQLVASTQYPPDGYRGIAGSRATGYGRNFAEYVEEANGDILCIAQIETAEGVENTDAIAAVPGIDSLFVGPADLSGALGVFGEWGSETFKEAVNTVVGVAHDNGTPVGTFGTGEETIRQRVDMGFDYMIAGKDATHIAEGCRNAKRVYEGAVTD